MVDVRNEGAAEERYEEPVAFEEMEDTVWEDATELRPMLGEFLVKMDLVARTYDSPWPAGTFSESCPGDVLPAGPRCVASTPRECLASRP